MTSPMPEFSEFFHDIHGATRDPFPWQTALAAEVLADDAWPDVIDVPTGLGKTATLDVAVYALAAGVGTSRGVGRRRILFVVDRQLVVDEAFQHALQIVDALERPRARAANLIAERLRSLRLDDVDNAALRVTRMRGGTSWDANWVDRPDQPAIVLGTVDQLGSRWLFRGYNTTDQRKPIDAALIGLDSLVLVDEAHLAKALLETTEAARVRDVPLTPLAVPVTTVVSLSATVGRAGTRFDFDIEANRRHEVARKRLDSNKRLGLVRAADAKKTPQLLAAVTMDALVARPGARALIVCNTVMRARQTRSAVLELLRRRKLEFEHEPALLMGRSRPFDREQLIPDVLRRFGTDRPRLDLSDVDVLVATQTVEVGANLDVDVLVSESAPLDSITQRLGRLDRLGESTLDPIAVVVDDGSTVDDSVYPGSRLAAWTFLCGQLGAPTTSEASAQPFAGPWLPASPLAMKELLRGAGPSAVAVPPQTPRLFDRILDAWVQTSPIPEPDPPLSAYLHGLGRTPDTVTLFWRDDLTEGSREEVEFAWPAALDLLPYVAPETIEVPLNAFRAWLGKSAAPPVADIDISDAVMESPSERLVALQRSDTWTVVSSADRRIRGGSVVAVPATYGGLDRYGWDPTSMTPVTDVRELVGWTGRSDDAPRRRVPAIRIDERTLARVATDDPSPEARDALRGISALVHDAMLPEDHPDALTLVEFRSASVASLARCLDVHALSPGYEQVVPALGHDAASLVVQQRAGAAFGVESPKQERRWVITRRRRDYANPGGADGGELSSATSSGRVTLADHHAAVGERARKIAAAVLGPDAAELHGLVELAATHHDLGKLDPRFQAALLDGDVLRAELLDEPLAKSGIAPRSEQARRARRLSGLPRGFRHEAWSARLAAQALAHLEGWRLDLVVHLVASHHGYGRSLLPPVPDREPRVIEYRLASGEQVDVVTDSAASVDPESARRFAELNARFGRWGLAMLETIVRSADQTCSREGS